MNAGITLHIFCGERFTTLTSTSAATNRLKFATNLDGFRAVVARNLNKARKWRECSMSCKAERRTKDR
jgi:hypothetical protein